MHPMGIAQGDSKSSMVTVSSDSLAVGSKLPAKEAAQNGEASLADSDNDGKEQAEDEDHISSSPKGK